MRYEQKTNKMIVENLLQNSAAIAKSSENDSANVKMDINLYKRFR